MRCAMQFFRVWRWWRQIWADWFAEVLLLKLSFHGMALVNSRLKVWKQRIFRLSRGILSPLHWHMLVLVSLWWAPLARMVRGEVLQIREKGYITAAKANGLSDVVIIFRHAILNVMSPVVAYESKAYSESVRAELSDTTLLAAWKDVFSDTLPARIKCWKLWMSEPVRGSSRLSLGKWGILASARACMFPILWNNYNVNSKSSMI